MGRYRLWVVALIGSLPALFWATEASAQSNPNQKNQGVISTGSEFGYNQDMQRVIGSTRIRRPPTISSSSRFTRGLAGSALSISPNARSKPFTGVQRRPTLSPYLNLLRNDGDDLGGLPNYHTFVRPAVDQQRTNRRTNQQIQGLGQDVQAVNRQLAHQPSEASILRPTGHQTVFMNLSHYYPQTR